MEMEDSRLYAIKETAMLNGWANEFAAIFVDNFVRIVESDLLNGSTSSEEVGK